MYINVQIYRKQKGIRGGNTIVTPPLRVVQVDCMVVYHIRGTFNDGTEYTNNCLRSCDYNIFNRNHAYTMRYSNVD